MFLLLFYRNTDIMLSEEKSEEAGEAEIFCLCGNPGVGQIHY